MYDVNFDGTPRAVHLPHRTDAPCSLSAFPGFSKVLEPPPIRSRGMRCASQRAVSPTLPRRNRETGSASDLTICLPLPENKPE